MSCKFPVAFPGNLNGGQCPRAVLPKWGTVPVYKLLLPGWVEIVTVCDKVRKVCNRVIFGPFYLITFKNRPVVLCLLFMKSSQEFILTVFYKGII